MQTNFKLDTSSFAECANASKKLAEELENAMLACDKSIDSLYFSWSGKARNEFEKKYKIFEHQVTDIKNALWDLYEDIVAAEESYIQADTDAAKAMDGVNEGVTKDGLQNNK